MQLKRFKGKELPEVVRQVREELGPEAVILHTKAARPRGLLRFLGGAGVEVVAAVDQEAGSGASAGDLPRLPGPGRSRLATGGSRPSIPSAAEGVGADAYREEVAQLRNLLIRFSGARALPSTLAPFYAWLIENGVEDELAFRFLQTIAPTNAQGRSLSAEALGQALDERVTGMIRTAGATIPPRGVTLAFVGPPGAGKTTTLSKLAVHAHVTGVTPNILSFDGVGLGATRQLDTLSTLLGLPYALAVTPDDVARPFGREAAGGLTLIDTPGVSPRDAAGIRSVGELLHAARPAEIHLVLPATTKTDDAMAVVRACAPLEVTHLAFTKLDETTTYGSILSIAILSKLPLSYLATGREVPNDIQPATAREVARRVLQGDPAR